jgi:hypothetical protein
VSVIYIGVDDTDILGSAGTGRVARGLAKHLQALGRVRSLGVSRHQLLVDNRIRYTSHNSSKGIAVETERPVSDLYEPGIAYLAGCYQVGADPGLGICREDQVNQEILDFGREACSSVLTKDAALSLARKHGLFLKELGGSGDGVIGALAAIGLRAGGNDGRLVDLNGIHDITGLLTVAELLRRTDIDRVEETGGRVLGGNEVIDSQDRIRPSLVGGRPVLRVEPDGKRRAVPTWLPVERKLRHNKKGE